MWICNLLKNTTFLTIISGVGVFILGQLFVEYFLKPLQRYRQLRAKAAYCLTFYANRFDNSVISGDTSEELRKMAAELISFANEKPIVVFPVSRKRLQKASEGFIGLSNSIHDNTNRRFESRNDRYAMISKTLKLTM